MRGARPINGPAIVGPGPACYLSRVANRSTKSRSEVLAESRRKGAVATGAAVATGVATATIGFLPLGALGLGATGVLTWRWVKHRAKNGIRF